MTAPTEKENGVPEQPKNDKPAAEGSGNAASQASSVKFTATHGVHLADLGVGFTHDPSAEEKVSKTGQQGGVGSRTYRLESSDPKVIEGVRKLAQGDNEYGIAEDSE